MSDSQPTSSGPGTKRAVSPRDRLVERAHGHPLLAEVYKLVAIVIGAIIFAIGLEGFLLPNDFLDGGVVGIAIIATYVVKLPMGIYIGLFNIPFIILAWFKIGRRSAVRSAVGIGTLTVATTYLHSMDEITDQSWLALICGGAMIGVGVGLALRHGGALDGTEVLATVLASNTKFTVGQVILYLNLAIFTVAGFVISWESALLSAVLFYVVVKDLVDQIAHGESGARLARVITRNRDEAVRVVSAHTKRPVLVASEQKYHPDTGAWEDVWVLQFATTRLEEASIVEEVTEIDPRASITFSDVANLHGPMADALNAGAH